MKPQQQKLLPKRQGPRLGDIEHFAGNNRLKFPLPILQSIERGKFRHFNLEFLLLFRKALNFSLELMTCVSLNGNSIYGNQIKSDREK